MNADFIRERITELRLKKGVSEHQMSMELGHARSYIHGSVNGPMPKMAWVESITKKRVMHLKEQRKTAKKQMKFRDKKYGRLDR
ncbi:MAG: hypothetical protein Q4E24_15600 [bacterium]|nr:hypothetical protein [bacterium]